MEIVDFRPEQAAAFKALNEAWITRYFALEPKDVELLDAPAQKIIAPGGHILLAIEDGSAVGCVALMAMPGGGFEVAKMAVPVAAPLPGLLRVEAAAGFQP